MPTNPTYRAHICIEFTSDDPEVEADQMARDIANLFSLAKDVSVWLDDVTEPDQGQTP